jgi:hypothetical protein
MEETIKTMPSNIDDTTTIQQSALQKISLKRDMEQKNQHQRKSRDERGFCHTLYRQLSDLFCTNMGESVNVAMFESYSITNITSAFVLCCL